MILCLLIKKQIWFHFPSVEISVEGRRAQKKPTESEQRITHNKCVWSISARNIHASLKITLTWPWPHNLSIKLNQKHYHRRPWRYHILSSNIKMWLVWTTAPALWWKNGRCLKLSPLFPWQTTENLLILLLLSLEGQTASWCFFSSQERKQETKDSALCWTSA